MAWSFTLPYVTDQSENPGAEDCAELRRHSLGALIELVGGKIIMNEQRVIVLLDGDDVIATFIVSPGEGVDIDARMQECQEYAERSALRLVEMRAPMVRTVREMGLIDEAIHSYALQRHVAHAPRDVAGLKDLGRDEMCILAIGVHDLQGRPDGTPPFEDLDEQAMAERLAEKLAEHDRLRADAA